MNKNSIGQQPFGDFADKAYPTNKTVEVEVDTFDKIQPISCDNSALPTKHSTHYQSTATRGPKFSGTGLLPAKTLTSTGTETMGHHFVEVGVLVKSSKLARYKDLGDSTILKMDNSLITTLRPTLKSKILTHDPHYNINKAVDRSLKINLKKMLDIPLTHKIKLTWIRRVPQSELGFGQSLFGNEASCGLPSSQERNFKQYKANEVYDDKLSYKNEEPTRF